MELHTQTIDLSPAAMRSLVSISPGHYRRSGPFTIVSSATAAGRRTMVSPSDLGVAIGAIVLPIRQQSLDLNLASSWDAIAPTNYTVEVNRAGKDFSIFALTSGKLICSPNAIAPTGYTVINSMLIGGFHCLPPYFVSATDKTPIYTGLPGLAGSHPAYGYWAGDIIPTSIWDLLNCPSPCAPNGMAKVINTESWVDIYKQSGSGSSTASVWNGTCTRSRTWNDTDDDFHAVRKKMIDDLLWKRAMTGCPEGVNIAGSVDPQTAGLFLMTNGVPNISSSFIIGGPGEGYEWLSSITAKTKATTVLGTDPAFGWTGLQGKGSIYTQGCDIVLLAGGYWANGSLCGSRSRNASSERWSSGSVIGSRGCARSR